MTLFGCEQANIKAWYKPIYKSYYDNTASQSTSLGALLVEVEWEIAVNNEGQSIGTVPTLPAIDAAAHPPEAEV